jgi:hypothetical protein
LAQKSTRNNLYAEGLGLAGYYSLNYERIQPITRNRSVLLGADLGFGLLRYDYAKGYAFPFRLNLCVGRKGIYGEIGADYLITRHKEPSVFHSGTYGSYLVYKRWFVHGGIRYQPIKKRIFFRAFIFPIEVKYSHGSIIYFYGERDAYNLKKRGVNYIWWGGIDVGWAF